MDTAGVGTGNGKPIEVALEACPWCGQTIPHDRFEEIQAKIAAREREQFLEVEAGLNADFGRQQAEAEIATQARLEKAQGEAAAALEAAKKQSLLDIAAAREEGGASAAAELAKARAETKAAADQLGSFKAEHDKTLAQRLLQQRQVLEAETTKAVNGERAKHFEEKLKLEEKLQDLQRQVQNKTAGELGEGAEIDL